MRRGFSIFIVLMLMSWWKPNLIFAQEVVKPVWETNATAHFGYLIPHSPEVKAIGQSLPRGLQVDFGYQTLGIKEWEQAYNYPMVGFNINYFDMVLPDVLGHTLSATAYIEPYLYRGHRFKASYRIGPGLVYATRLFHEEQNPSNVAMSSPVSFVMQGSINTYFDITDQVYFKAGTGITHYSNGAIRMPNAGLNILTASAGLGYRFGLVPTSFIYKEPEATPRKLSVEFMLSGAVNEHLPIGNGQHYAWTTAISLSQRLSRKSGLFIGGEVYTNTALRTLVANWPGMEGADYRRAGISVGHELYISRFSMLTQAGYYVYQPVPFNINYYQRLMLKYYFTKNLFATWGLKTHLARAEFLDFGLGVRM